LSNAFFAFLQSGMHDHQNANFNNPAAVFGAGNTRGLQYFSIIELAKGAIAIWMRNPARDGSFWGGRTGFWLPVAWPAGRALWSRRHSQARQYSQLQILPEPTVKVRHSLCFYNNVKRCSRRSSYARSPPILAR
jgi:hypothetical protein